MRATQWIPTGVRSRLKIARARAFERVGSTRYSYPALNRLDRLMLERLPDEGTFLEVGANDGYSQSNTYYLERRRGWRGVLIEPLPSLFRVCASHREADCYNFACVGPDGATNLTLVDRGLMTVSLGLLPAEEEKRRVASHDKLVEVPTAKLSSLIDRSSIDSVTFMSVDVEGAELDVLAGLDLDRHSPEFLLVETGKLDQVKALLSGRMRHERQLSHHDHLFRPC